MKAKVTPKMFDCVKMLVEGGATTDECAKYFGLSGVTVSRIRTSETFEEYKQSVIASVHSVREKKKEQKESMEPQKVIQQTVTVQATHYMMEELKQMNEHLKLISNKLAFIVEELTGTGVKKDV